MFFSQLCMTNGPSPQLVVQKSLSMITATSLARFCVCVQSGCSEITALLGWSTHSAVFWYMMFGPMEKHLDVFENKGFRFQFRPGSKWAKVHWSSKVQFNCAVYRKCACAHRDRSSSSQTLPNSLGATRRMFLPKPVLLNRVTQSGRRINVMCASVPPWIAKAEILLTHYLTEGITSFRGVWGGE